MHLIVMSFCRPTVTVHVHVVILYDGCKSLGLDWLPGLLWQKETSDKSSKLELLMFLDRS